MKYKIILLLLILVKHLLISQNKEAHQWILEQFSNLDFNSGNLKIKLIEQNPLYGMGSHNSTLCNKNGAILVSTGGCFILNKEFKLLDGGDSINSSFTYRSWCKGNSDGDFPVPQNNIIIPYPDSVKLIITLNLDYDYAPIRSLNPTPYNIYYNIIDINQNGGLGKVIESKKIALADTLSRGYLQAIRHINGVNWWSLVPKWNSNCIFVNQITKSGISVGIKHCLGRSWDDDDLGGQVSVSPNGSRVARIGNKNYVIIYNFNTSNGELSNPVELTFPEQIRYFRGVSFSSNSKCLYVAANLHLYQFNLDAPNIQNSLQLVGQLPPVIEGSDKGSLRFAKLAPDGKIYISSPFSHKFLSVINRPNCIGRLCDFRPHAIELPAYNYNGLPNNPFFEIPPANYSCDSIPSATTDVIEEISIYPNPTTNQISISSTYDFHDYTVLDITGKTVIKGALNSKNEISVSTLADGLYFLHLKNTSTQARAVGKFVVKH